MYIEIITLCNLVLTLVSSYEPVCIDRIQERNLKVLSFSLKQGYIGFCASDIDQAVLSLQPDGDPRDSIVELVDSSQNQTYLLKDICQICTGTFDHTKKTIIYINGFLSESHDLSAWIRDIAKCSNSYNVIILNFSQNLAMLYNTAVSNIPIYAYAVLKMLDTLLLHKVPRYSIVLAGHSQGAQIAALAAKQFYEENGWKLALLVALDPAVPCDPANQYVNPTLATQVLVIHGNNRDFGLREAVGTVDYYPNGDETLQPGCTTQACSHEFAVRIFTELVCNPSSIMAVRCNDWSSFEKNVCNKRDIIPICLRIPLGAKGKYYSITKSQPPYGLAFKGLAPGKLIDWRSSEVPGRRVERESWFRRIFSHLI